MSLQSENKLPLDFYQNQTTSEIAKKLLGQKLVRSYRNKKLSGIIVETEAYLGINDPACHSRNGLKSKRNISMYLRGGHAYVYFIYGMYYCFNIVTKSENEPEAILIRAIEPKDGIETMQKARKTKKLLNLASGPGKLAQAMYIDKAIDGKILNSPTIHVVKTDTIIKDKDIITTTRIGIAKNNPAANWDLRFYIKDNPFVSKK